MLITTASKVSKQDKWTFFDWSCVVATFAVQSQELGSRRQWTQACAVMILISVFNLMVPSQCIVTIPYNDHVQ